jgi:hypothetical protein
MCGLVVVALTRNDPGVLLDDRRWEEPRGRKETGEGRKNWERKGR